MGCSVVVLGSSVVVVAAVVGRGGGGGRAVVELGVKEKLVCGDCVTKLLLPE